jgi:hypothetical protein
MEDCLNHVHFRVRSGSAAPVFSYHPFEWQKMEMDRKYVLIVEKPHIFTIT